MALGSVPGYYVPGAFNAAQIAGYNALTKKKVPSSTPAVNVEANNPPVPDYTDWTGPLGGGLGPGGSYVVPGFSTYGGSTDVIPYGSTVKGGKSLEDTLRDLFGQKPSTGYEAEMLADPTYQGVMNAYNKALAAGRASLVGNLNSAVTQAGFDPRAGFTGDLAPYASDITDATIQSALTNPMSARAQLQAQTDTARKLLGYQLAARGVERSGELSTGNTYLNNQYETQSTQQLNNLLNAVRSGVGDYQSQIQSLEANKNNAVSAIADRIAAANQNTYTPDDILAIVQAYQSQGGDGGLTITPPDSSGSSGPSGPVAPADALSRVVSSGQNVFTPSTPKVKTVTVDGRVFSSRSDLTRYLQSRGKNPALWAQNNNNLWLGLGA